MRIFSALSLAVTVLLLAGCGGGGASSSALPGGPGPGSGSSGSSSQTQSEDAISATNAFGSPVKNITNFNNNVALQSMGRVAQSLQSGTCSSGFEFFSPDKNGDSNSTESQYFYDSTCTQLARDVVRKFVSNGNSSETVNRTESQYAYGSSTASATRTETNTITNATFDKDGFPIVASGFERVTSDTLNLSGVKTIDSDAEIVMLAGSGGSNQYCSDSAGFNATGIASLNETFGWQGGVLAPGTRTLNSDGSVTWNSTHTGSVSKGPIATLSVATGIQNTACPITTPMFTLTGGTQTGAFSIPITVTYKLGLLQSLRVTNAALANGNTLNVTTNTSVQPQNSLFINGVISNGGSTVATFNTDAFGDGTLTLASSGKQFVITDWHVVK
ncbi:MAG: hypothetical protein ABR584_01850 [Candidatus Baltobacteraceae bacterium]